MVPNCQTTGWLTGSISDWYRSHEKKTGVVDRSRFFSADRVSLLPIAAADHTGGRFSAGSQTVGNCSGHLSGNPVVDKGKLKSFGISVYYYLFFKFIRIDTLHSPGSFLAIHSDKTDPDT
jgi:hypothetical protein